MSTSTYVMTKMGLMKKKSSVDPKYCRPQGLYSSHNLNLKKLKKLILAGKLAPLIHQGALGKAALHPHALVQYVHEHQEHYQRSESDKGDTHYGLRPADALAYQHQRNRDR